MNDQIQVNTVKLAKCPERLCALLSLHFHNLSSRSWACSVQERKYFSMGFVLQVRHL
jgi:hypothetical protein